MLVNSDWGHSCSIPDFVCIRICFLCFSTQAFVFLWQGTDTYSTVLQLVWNHFFPPLKCSISNNTVFVKKYLTFLFDWIAYINKAFGRLEWLQFFFYKTYSYFLVFQLCVDMWPGGSKEMSSIFAGDLSPYLTYACGVLGPPCAQRWLPRRTSWARKPSSGCSERLRQSKLRHKCKEIMLPIKQGLGVSSKLSMSCHVCFLNGLEYF